MKCTPFSRYYLYKRSVEMCRSLPFQARILCGSYVHSMMWLSCCFIKKMRETPSSSTWTAPNGTKEACLNRFTAMRCAKSLLKTFVKLCFSSSAIFNCLSVWNFLNSHLHSHRFWSAEDSQNYRKLFLWIYLFEKRCHFQRIAATFDGSMQTIVFIANKIWPLFNDSNSH